MSTKAHPALSEVATSLSLPQAAQYLGVHDKTIRRWIKDGRLPAVRIGGDNGRFRVALRDLDALMQKAA